MDSVLNQMNQLCEIIFII